MRDLSHKKAWFILIGLIAVYVVVFLLICFWKYHAFKYGGLDLAIYNQVFYNSSFGRFFEFSIHPHSYLGDHFELLIIFLLPLYFICKSPLTLLVLQTLVLALCAIPLGLIARNIFRKNWALVLGGAWILISPFIQNIATFEFHILPFAIFILLFSFYFFQKNNYSGFLISLFFALITREDVAFAVIGLGILALFEKKKNKILWGVVPIILGIAWLAIALKIGSIYSGYGHYKFIIYYSWLGSTPLEFIKNIFLKPGLVLKFLFGVKNINFALIMLLSFAFLPFFRIKYLIPSALVWLQYFFSSSGNELIYRTHYSSLLLPWLFIASLYGLEKLKSKIKSYQIIYLAVFGVIIIYAMLTLGPIIPYLKAIAKTPPNRAFEIQTKNELIKKIPQNASVIATYDLLPKLSSRENIYSLYYTYFGKKQLSDEPYLTPQNIDYAIFDFDDIVEFQIQMKSRGQEEKFMAGDNNFRKFIEGRSFQILNFIDKYALLKTSASSQKTFYEFITAQPNQEAGIIDSQISFWQPQKIDGQTELYFRAEEEIKNNYQLELVLEKNNKEVYSQIYPLGLGLYPTSEWQEGQIIKLGYNFFMPAGPYQAKLYLVEIESGNLAIININSIDITNLKVRRLLPAIELN